MIKSILTSSYDFGQQNAHFIGVGSKGVDPEHIKRASASEVFKEVEIKPEDGKAVIHLIAMGASPFYPCNKNGDFYYDHNRKVELKSGDTYKLEKGLEETHPTFVTGAKVYKEHFNTKDDKVYGDVLGSHYNDDQKRVELLIKIPVDEWVPELSKLERGEDFGFSMSCSGPDTLVRTIEGFTRISDITVGDSVLTHTGEFHGVTATMEHDAEETIDIKVACVTNDDIIVTPEHPFLIGRMSYLNSKFDAFHPKYRQRYEKENKDKLCDYLKWVPAGEVRKGDFVAIPIPKYEGSSDLDVDLAKLYGYYLAEGSLTGGYRLGKHQHRGVAFTVNINDIFVEEVEELCKSLPYTSIKHVPRSNTEHALDITLFGTEVGKHFMDLLSYNEAKHIPEDIFKASREARLAFVTGWINGDGWQDYKGIHVSMASSGKVRSHDLQLLLATVGVPSSITCITHRPRIITNGKVSPVEKEYVVNVANRFARLFLDYGPTKVKAKPDPKFKRDQVFISGNYLMTKVKRVSASDYVGPVYNFSVDKDESYTMNSVAVHNCRVPYDVCSVCGQKATRRNEYCTHMKYELGQVDSDGWLVGAINDHTDFFDISGVANPADRIAFGLLKVAAASDHSGRIIGGAELSELLNISQDQLYYKTSSVLRKLAEIEKQIEATASADSPVNSAVVVDDLPEECLEQIKASRTSTPQILGALSDAKVTLSLSDFLRILLGPQFGEVRHLIGDASNRLPGVFSRMCVRSVVPDGVIGLENAPLPMRLRPFLSDMINSNSLGSEPVTKRVTIRVIRGDVGDVKLKSASVKCDDSAGEVLAQLYGQYKLAFCHKHLCDKDLTFYSVLSHYIQ